MSRTIHDAVAVRLRIERAAGPILGVDKMNGISDRDLMVAVVERLQGEGDSCDKKSDDYVRARFDVAVQSHALVLDPDGAP